MRKNFTIVAALFAAVFLATTLSSPVDASKQCPTGMDCKIPIEEVAQMLALFTNITEACATAKPEMASRYKAGFTKMLEKEQAPDLIKSARQHPQYKEFLKLAQQEVLKTSTTVLMHDCDALLKQ